MYLRHIFFTVKLVSNIRAILCFFCLICLFWRANYKFERKNDFEPTVLKIAKNKEKSVSENVFFNGNSYLKIPLRSIDLTYTTNNSNAFLLIPH